MAVYRQVYTNIWRDKIVSRLTSTEHLVLLYLLTHPESTQAGIVTVLPALACVDTGYTWTEIEAALKRLEELGKILWNKPSDEIIILDWLKCNPAGSPKVLQCIIKELAKIDHAPFVALFWKEYIKATGKQLPEGISIADIESESVTLSDSGQVYCFSDDSPPCSEYDAAIVLGMDEKIAETSMQSPLIDRQIEATYEKKENGEFAKAVGFTDPLNVREELLPILAERSEELFRYLVPGTWKKYDGYMVTGDRNGSPGVSLSAQITGPNSGLWQDRNPANEEAGNLIQLWALQKGVEYGTAVKEIKEYVGLGNTSNFKSQGSGYHFSAIPSGHANESGYCKQQGLGIPEWLVDAIGAYSDERGNLCYKMVSGGIHGKGLRLPTGKTFSSNKGSASYSITGFDSAITQKIAIFEGVGDLLAFSADAGSQPETDTAYVILNSCAHCIFRMNPTTVPA